MLLGPVVTTTTSPTFIFGFTLSQTLLIFFMGITAISTLITAVTMTSKYFAVKYVSVEDKEALDFSREMRNTFRQAVLNELEENPPFTALPKYLKKEEDE